MLACRKSPAPFYGHICVGRQVSTSPILEVPDRSPLAALARRLSADAAALAKAEDALRANITQCPCWADQQCPAMNQANLRHALEHAVDPDSQTH